MYVRMVIYTWFACKQADEQPFLYQPNLPFRID